MSRPNPPLPHHHWTEIAESVSLVACVVGAGFAILLEKILFVTTPVCLSLVLNLINRQRLAARYAEDKLTDLPQLQQSLSAEMEALRAAVLALGSEINPRYLQETLTSVEANLSDRLSILDTLNLKTMEEELAQLRNQSHYLLESLAQILQRLDHLPTEDRLTTLETHFTQISQEVQTLKQDLEIDLTQLHGQYGRLQEDLTHSFQQITDRLTTGQAAIQTQIDRLDLSALQTASSQLETLETTINRLGAQSSELLGSIVHITEQLKQLPVVETSPHPHLEPQFTQFQTQLSQLTTEITHLQSQIQQRELTLTQGWQTALTELQTQLNQQNQLLLTLATRLAEHPQPQTIRSEPTAPELRSFTERAEQWVSRIKQGIEGWQSQMDFEPDLSQKDEWGDEQEWEMPPSVSSPPPRPSPVSAPSATGWECVKSISHGSSAVTCLAVSADGSVLVSGGYQDIKAVNLSTYEVQSLALETGDGSVSSVALSADGKTLAAATGEIEIWNLRTGKRLQLLECEDWTTVVAISPDGKTLVSGGSETLEEKSSLRFWDFARGEMIRTNYYVDYEIDSLGFAARGGEVLNGGMLAIAGRNRNDHKGLIQVWPVGASSPQMTLEVTMALYAVALTPDAQMLAGGCGDRTIKLWNCSTRGLVRTFSGHDGIVYTISLSPNGQLLASGSHDQTIKLWQLETAEALDTLLGHQGPVTAVVFTPDGKTLISGSQDGTVKIWQQHD